MAEVRRCVGSTRFGIEPHNAPVGEFSAQPSQKDGLSRLCTLHWREYVVGLAREAKERKAAAATGDVDSASTKELTGKATRRPKATAVTTVAQESASG